MKQTREKFDLPAIQQNASPVQAADIKEKIGGLPGEIIVHIPNTMANLKLHIAAKVGWNVKSLTGNPDE